MIFKEVIFNSSVKLSPYMVEKLANVSSKFKSHIFFETFGRRTNAKSIIGLIAMGLKNGDKFTIVADGKDEIMALETVIETLEKFN